MENKETKNAGIGTKFLLGLAALIVILAGLKAAQTLVAPFLLAVFFAMILMPPLRWLKKKGLSDWVAWTVMIFLVGLVGFLMIVLVGSSLSQFAKKVPVYQKKMSAHIQKADEWINSRLDQFEEIEKNLPRLNREIKELSDENDAEVTNEIPAKKEPFSLSKALQFDAFFGYLQTGATTLLNMLSVSFLVAIMVIFMAVEAAGFPEKVKAAFDGRDLSNEYFERIAQDTWNYTILKTEVCFLTGLATALGLWCLGIEYALLWGLLMFFLNYIPNIGQFIAAVPPVLLAMVDHNFVTVAAVIAWLVVVNCGFGFYYEPMRLGKGLGISTLIVLLSLIFWGWLLGPIGMFLSAPLTMVLKIVLQNGTNTRWMAVLMGNR